MSGWTLATGGVTKSFAAWGLTNPRRRSSSFDGGTVTVEQPTARGVDEAIVAYLGTVVIAVDGVTVFTGLRTGLRRKGSGDACGLVYEFRHAATYYMEKLFYQQAWFSGDTTDVLLHHSGTAYLRTGEQISDVIAWAVSCGAPIQAGTIEAGIYLPIDQQTDRVCMEIIQQEARWSPDAIAFFDDSVTPARFHFKRRANLAELTVALPTDRTRWEVTPRDDLVIPAVKIIFKRVNEVDGQVSYQFATDVAPEGASGKELGALVQTMDLEGVRVSRTIAEIETEPLITSSGDPGYSDFWSHHIAPKQNTTQWQNVTVTFLGVKARNTGADVDYSALPNVLVSGTLNDTMRLEDDTPVAWRKVRLWVRIQADRYDSSGTLVGKVDFEHYIDKTITNATTGEYVASSESESGEPVNQFLGMAAYLYAARSEVQYEGSVTLTEVEAGDLLRDAGDNAGWMGRKLNLTGGRTEWATMGAVIHSVDENWTTGEVTLRFGPVNRAYSFDNIKELVRANRNRRRRNSTGARATGSAEEDSTELGKETPDNIAQAQDPAYTYLKVNGTQPIELKSETGEVNIGADILIQLADAGGKVIRLREYTFCYRDPTTGVSSQKRVIMLGSEFYG
jgi:hypothetical protein